MILVGAFDNFDKNRATLLQAIDQVLDTTSDVEQDDMLFDILTPKQVYEDKEELPDKLLSNFEKEYLGFYISKHPVEKEFEKKQYLGIYKLSNAQNFQPILVQFDTIKQIRTKNGQNMAFVTLNDGMTLMDGVIFPDKFKRYEASISNEEMFIVIGKFEKRNQQLQLIINQIIEINTYKNEK